MAESSNRLREVAEHPNSFGPLGPSDERLETGRYTLCMGLSKSFNTVQRQRFALEDVDAVLEDVRRELRDRGRSKTQWEIGSSAPPGLADALLERGLRRDSEPFAIAMVLSEPPPPGPPEVIVRRAETFEDFAAAVAVQWAAFGGPDEDAATARAQLEQRWRETPHKVHAAWLQDSIVGAGTCAPTEYGLLLYGGATLPSARGRGAYRALIRARWDDAVAAGTPALLTQAGAMSRPILERLGFRAVGRIDMLIDEF